MFMMFGNKTGGKGGSSGGKGRSSGGGKGSGSGGAKKDGNWPSTTGKPSGNNRGNGPRK
jgi:hypothetical protein